MNKMRRDSELKIKDLFVEAKAMAHKMDISLALSILLSEYRRTETITKEIQRHIFSFSDHLSIQLKIRSF